MIGGAVRAGIVAVVLALVCGWAMPQESSSSGAIAGDLLDSSGKPVSGAEILLAGVVEQHAVSNASGEFRFPGLAPGHYRVTASTPAAGNASTSIDVVAGVTARVQLRLEPAPAAVPKGNGSAGLAQAMQFADDPHFTVAGITDWTAAGGHGSDANLRTSEALTRETVELQSDDPWSTNRCSEDEAALRAAVVRQSGSFEARHCLGILYLRNGHYADAAASLESAYKLKPSDSENEYALARACEKAGNSDKAHEHLQKLSAREKPGDLHRLAGEVDESLGDPVDAVNEFAQAVRMDPSEQNYFAWGSELLYHRAVWQARDVFEQGVKAWPRSARMVTALGASLFAGALYDDAAERLCQAATLEPDNAEPYLFMGRIEVAVPHPLPCVEQKLAEFHQRNPGNALADYYYAMALWKQHQVSANASADQQITTLLQQAVAADPRCGEAWLELGNLQAQSGHYASSISLYSRATDAMPQLSEAWYRLGVAYDRTGQRDKAREAFAQHDRIEKEQAAAVEAQRRAIKQFVISSTGSGAPGPNR